MARKFTVIPMNTFQAMQLDAGVLLWDFDPEHPAAPDDEDIICATSGGITISDNPTFSDLGEDVDNCPKDMMELKNLDGRESKVSFSSLATSTESIQLALGAADIDGNKITPRNNLALTDFKTIWWAGDRADGGCVAVKIENALSTGGFSLKTGKNEKGQTSMELTGHRSLANQSKSPFTFYSIDPDGTTTYTVSQSLSHVTSSFSGNSVNAGASFTATLTADTDYTIDEVTVYMGGVDVTQTAYTSATGAISIGNVTGNISITATATST